MTRVASTSTTSGAPASTPWSGARPPACCQARGDRVLAFFDGTYAVALNLLVTTLDPTDVPGAWSDPGALWVAIGTEVVAFLLAFAVVAFYWCSNHAFVARLHHLSGRLVTVNLVSLAFVVLLPFSTDALGQFPQPLATAVFAGNVALIACMEAVLSLLAWRDGLMSAPPSPRRMRLEPVPPLVPSAVFLASISVAYLVSSAAARLSWLALVVLNPLVGILIRRAASRA